MDDVTAAVAADRLSGLFAAYNDRLVRRLRARLGRYDWHLAEDLASETWARAVRGIENYRGTDEQAFGWLARISDFATADHYRAARNTRETATDFTGPAAYVLPSAPTAEDEALAHQVILAMLTQAPTPLGVAA
ncbi:sigma factor [Streptomyces sp. NPDC002992]|uniref:RNA polymerase sigma factor n=1 Tax=Streptomyces sp. NPDC002992 TaxID=3154273 RepID=UPI00339FC4D5